MYLVLALQLCYVQFHLLVLVPVLDSRVLELHIKYGSSTYAISTLYYKNLRAN